MKKVLFSAILLLVGIFLDAQTPDSCYVYTNLHWRPGSFRYKAQIQLNPQTKDMDIVNENGEVLVFESLFHALNFYSAQGWELVDVSRKNPENNGNYEEQYAVIRKMFPTEEAKRLYIPDPSIAKPKK